MNLGHCDLAMSGVLSSGLRNENAVCHRFGLLRLKKTSRTREGEVRTDFALSCS